MTAHPRQVPTATPDVELDEAARDRHATEQLLERIAVDDLAEHREQVGALSSLVGRAVRTRW